MMTAYPVSFKDLNDLKSALLSDNLTTIKELQQRHMAFFKSTLSSAAPTYDGVQTDAVAKQLLPASMMNNYRPLLTPGDGNCLFNAVSIALTGSTILSTTLRLLTAIEIRSGVINNYFLHPNIVDNVALNGCDHHRETHVAMIISDDEVERIRHEQGDTEALKKLSLKTTDDGYWSCFVHFLALSNAIGYSIRSVYPKPECFCATIKHVMNGITVPLYNSSHGLINVMWSHTTSGSTKFFYPTHFVPLVNTDGFDSDEGIYNEETFAVLDSVVARVTTESVKATDETIPCEKMACSEKNTVHEELEREDNNTPLNTLCDISVNSSHWETDDNIPLNTLCDISVNTSHWETDDNIPLNTLYDISVNSSHWETDDNIPLKKLRLSDARFDNEVIRNDECTSDDSLSSYLSESDNCSADDGDDEEEINSSIITPFSWAEPFRNISRKAFIGSKSGPTAKVKSVINEMNIVTSFFEEDFFEKVAMFSNKYIPIYNVNNDTSLLSSLDISAYIGVRIIMGVDPKSCLDDYWSNDPCLRNTFISQTMSRTQFRRIHRLFHVDEQSTSAKTSSLDRVNFLLSTLKNKSKEYFNLHENISIDEAMIKFHGRHSGVVGAPNKPAKRGYKIYTLSDGNTGYVWDFEVYMRTQKREEGHTQRVVETLCKDIPGNYHTVYVDKFYTSISLALSLLKKKIYLCGSFNTSRKQWPTELKQQKKGCVLKKLKRGDYLCKQSSDGRMIATVWKDSSLVFNLSTCHNPKRTTIRRKLRTQEGWATVELNTTESIVDYNRYMGGVDRHDHLRANYTVQRPGHRWWKYFVWFLIDVSLVNTYILCKLTRPSYCSHKQFRIKVAKQLIGGYNLRSRRIRQRDVDGLYRSLAEGHQMTKFQGRQRVCRLCSKRKVKTRSGTARETKHGCAQCQIHLHKECFWQYHEEICRPVSKPTSFVDATTQTNNEQKDVNSESPVKSPPMVLRRSPRKPKLSSKLQCV